MDKVNMALVKLLAVSMGCLPSSCVELDAEQWQQLYNEATAHQIHSIIFSEAYKYGADVNPELFIQWKNMTIIQILKYCERFSVIGEMLDALENAAIPVMVLKGLHYRYLYNDPAMRTMGDVDILIARKHLDTAVDILQGFGYIKIKNDDPKHIQLAHKQYVPLEVHFALFTEAKRKKAVRFNDEIWVSAYRFEKDGLKFLVPSQINQLLYCCIHMTNHFGKGGFGLRQLSDFCLLVKSYSGQIDWDVLFTKADLYGIGRFTEIMLFICSKLFGLDVPQRILDKYSKDMDRIEQMVDAILEAGVFGDKDKRSSSSRIVASYMSMDGRRTSSKLRYIFPPIENLSQEYAYAHKYKMLLPAAWIHRIVNNIGRKDLSLSDKLPEKQKVDDYVRLFRWLDVKRD